MFISQVVQQNTETFESQRGAGSKFFQYTTLLTEIQFDVFYLFDQRRVCFPICYLGL